MTAFSLRKTPLEPDIKIEGPLQFCRRSNADRRLLAIVRERLSLSSGPTGPLATPRYAPSLDDGLVEQIIGDRIRSRTFNGRSDFFGKTGTVREPCARQKMSFGTSAPKWLAKLRRPYFGGCGLAMRFTVVGTVRPRKVRG
jgi:hypothetical protein